MAVINTGLLNDSIKSIFNERFNQTRTHFQDLATRIQSTQGTEKYRWLGSVPLMREWGTGRLAKALRGESYDVENQKYEATLEVDRDEISDDQTGQVRIRTQELAERAATHKDYLIGLLLANGASAGFISYDGVTFFNDAHVSGASGNQDNKLTSSASTPAAPTTAEAKAAIQAGIAAMLGFKDDTGVPLNLSEEGLVAVTPVNLTWAIREALNASIISSTSNIMESAARQLTFPWLTATDTFFLLKTDGAVRPFIFQDREPVEFQALAEGSEESFKREKFLYGVRARYAMGYGRWEKAVSIQFT